MKLYKWGIRIKEYEGTADVNIRFGIFIESKDFMQLKEDLESIYDKYNREVKRGEENE